MPTPVYKDLQGEVLETGDYVIIAAARYGTPHLKWGRVRGHTKTGLLSMDTCRIGYTGSIVLSKSSYGRSACMLKIPPIAMPFGVQIAFSQN